MQCIKCEEGELKKIKFIKTGVVAHMCDYCSTYWIDGELIKYNTGHALDLNAPDDEYAIQELNKTDEDHQAVRKVRII
jgi:hypothetical protein